MLLHSAGVAQRAISRNSPHFYRSAALAICLVAIALLNTSQTWAAATPTTTTLTVTSNGSATTSVAAGTVVTLTATVMSGSTPVNPGLVKFCDASAKYCEDSALLATAQLTTAGIATYKFRPGPGSHSYQAVFLGTDSYVTSASSAADLTVTFAGKYPTATTIASSGTVGNYSLTATVVSTAGGYLPPTGNVSFLDTTNGNASLGTAPLGTATQGNAFTTGSTPGVGVEPFSVAVGDFNGDGIPDLAVANYNSDSVSVLLGKGNGTFTVKSSPVSSGHPISVAVGDFNGDGIADLAVANFVDNTVTILLGNGDGTFTTKSSPNVGTSPRSVAVGDFNGDGIPDLVTVNAICDGCSGTVTVLLGNGDGTFTTKSSPSVGDNPYSITVADFNGDGIPDLATANSGDNTVTVLLGNGDGTFTTKSTNVVGSNPWGLAAADFNGDGITDLATANTDDGTITTLLGNGDGTFTSKSSPEGGKFPEGIAVADFNGDGIPDVAVANQGDISEGPDPATVLLGNGDGTFTVQSTPSVGNQPHAVAAADFNGDGTSDLVTANSGDNTATVLLNQITQTATASLSQVSLSGVETHLIEARYPGDTHYNGSTSATVPILAAQVATTLTITSSPNPSVYNFGVLVTATLSPYSFEGFTTDGETVTFYYGGTSIGSGSLASGVATLNVASLPVGADALTAVYAGDGNFAAATSNSLTQTVMPVPSYVVNVTTDTTTGIAANCTGAGSANCSLRDALAAALAAGSGNITFGSKTFGSDQTISLANGTLNIPPHTSITGPTAGSGAGLKNLVTVNGGGPVFTVGQHVTDTTISNLTITGGCCSDGGGILNSGVLTVSGCTISGNNSNQNATGFASGGGIENLGTLTLIDSTVTGNSVTAYGDLQGSAATGGGIDNEGTLTITNSSVVGNSAIGYLSGGISNVSATGAGINNYGSLTMTNSVVAGNSATANGQGGDPIDYAQASGGGIYGGLTAGANNIISGNTANGPEDDCDTYQAAPACPANGQSGNLVGSNVQLAPLGNYGGPTQTQPPLPGSPAICAGVIADIPPGVTTDQRGFPRTTTYGSNPPCVDSGSVQTNYSLSFSTEPPATIPATTNFTAAVQVMESGTPFPVSGIAVPMALATGDTGSLNVSSLTTNATGLATNDQFQISAPGNDKLVATLPITAATVTPAAMASTTSTAINVTQSSGVQVTVGALPSGLTFMVDGVSYSATTTLVWPLGSQHTLSAASPQGSAGTQYTFASWSDGGAITHTVTASTSTIDYTAAFNTAYMLTTVANPSNGGTISPASGYFPANSSVPLTATANPGYAFTSWTGNVASQSNPSTSIAMSAPQTVTANFATIPIYTVNTNIDDATGTAANCSSGNSTPCSLRDALAAAAAATSGADIEFDPTVFAANQPVTARTIVLGSAGTLGVPDNTRIFGPTTGSGPAHTQLVTINGKNLNYIFIFSTGNNTVLSGLLITNDPQATAISNNNGLTVIDCTISGNTGGSGITNSGALTVMDTTISGNSSNIGGGGILNQGGSVTVIDSTISGNTATGTPFPGPAASGGGIYNLVGAVTIINSTIAGNSGTGIAAWGGINQDVAPPYLTIANSTISGNTGGGVNVEEGIDLNSNNPIPVALTVTDSLLSGNITNGSEDDCDAYGTTCPASGQNGNFVGPNAMLAPLANYGGPTQTQPPLPGSPAICAGLIADIPAGITTDQRGFPRTTTYGSNPPCVDSGSVQTSYALTFSTEPPATIPATINFTAAVQLTESGAAFPVSGIGVPITLAKGDNGALNVASLTTNVAGIAASSQLQVSAVGNGDMLVATLPVTTTPPPAPLTSPVAVALTSTAFNVMPAVPVQVTAGTSPTGLAIAVDGVNATAPVTETWISGSQHTLATTSPQTVSGAQYTFTGWSDGTTVTTDMVTASPGVTAYTAAFSVAYLLTTSANAGGTVSPASGTYYAAGTAVNLIATPNPGYYFSGWTGSVASPANPSTTITMSAPETVTASFTAVPSFVVTVVTDDAGTASNCTDQSLQGATPDASCSLRDALAASGAHGGNITFDKTVFASAQTITLGAAGTLNIPSNTTIDGPTAGSGTTLTNLLTVSGGGPVFTVNGTNAFISSLTITGGSAPSEGGGILNNGTLTVSNSTISKNAVQVLTSYISGGGIENGGVMTLVNSTVTGNSLASNQTAGCNGCFVAGGGISNDGTMTITNSTIVGNSASINTGSGGGITSETLSGGGIINNGTLTMTNSVVAGNSAYTVTANLDGDINVSGGGIDGGVTTGTNNIISGNTANGSEDDCDTYASPPQVCPANGTNGNIVGSNVALAPLGNYGGPTQTQPPLPGSPAICAGVVADIPSGITTDQRGFPRTTTYGSNPPCVDSGSVQTSYTLGFSTQPPASVPPNVNFAAALQLRENGSPFAASGVAIPIALATGDNGALNVSSLSTNASGIAGSSQLQVSAVGNGDMLVATLPLTTTPPPAPLTAPITISATSSTFNVGQSNQTITFTPLASPVTFGVGPIALAATSTSGLPVAFNVTSGPGTVSGSTLTITGAGTVVVAASQAGNGSYLAATPVTQTIAVNKAVTAITLTSSSLNPALNSPVTFTATVTSSAGTPTGNVQFFDGTVAIGMSALNAKGVAVYSTSALGTGKHSISAIYAGDQNFSGSPSSALQVSVAEQSQTITFPALTTPETYGTAPLALKATASSGLAVSYAVTGPAKIASATLTITGAGTVVVTASQAGNSTYSAAAPVSQTIIVDKAASSTTVTSSGANANLGAALTFTATVSSTAGTPTGSVQFLDGATVLGTSPLNAQGTATFTTSTLTAGSHTINAVYSSDTNFAASQSSLTQVVVAPAFTLAADPSTLTLKAGQTGQIKITLTPVGGYTGSLTLACTGLPAQSSCSFNPPTLSADGSNTAVSTVMTITTTGPSTGTVTRLTPDTPGTGSAQTLLCWLPGGLLGLVFYWQRKRLSPAAKRTLWMVLLVAAAFGAAACGTPGSKTPPTQTTPAGNSTVTINASASQGSMQSISISLTITQ